jgi:hypothetical protein
VAELPDSDVAVLKQFADKIASDMAICRKTGRVIDDVADLIEEYRSEERKRLYHQLFGEDPL